MNNIPWWGYVILAGLAWGTYVPIIFYGGTELTTKPGTIGGRLASILCVGVAYFVLGVVVPVVLMSLRDDAKPDWKANGLVFSALAGVAALAVTQRHRTGNGDRHRIRLGTRGWNLVPDERAWRRRSISWVRALVHGAP